jgi:hypothetical protein
MMKNNQLILDNQNNNEQWLENYSFIDVPIGPGSAEQGRSSLYHNGTHNYPCVYLQMCMYMSLYIRIYMNAYIHINVYVYTYIHSYIHIYIYMYMYIHTYINK